MQVSAQTRDDPFDMHALVSFDILAYSRFVYATRSSTMFIYLLRGGPNAFVRAIKTP
jgi:hypothetical protein